MRMISWPLILVACTISEDAFPDKAADTMCDRVEECSRVFADDAERQNCESFWSGAAELLLDVGDLAGAVYDPAAGAACLREIRSATCAEFNDSELDCDLFPDEGA